MKILSSSLALGLLLTVSNRLTAQDLVSGPPAGTPLQTIDAYANSGPYAGRENFDAAKIIGDAPGAFLFIHVLNRNTAPVIRAFDNLVNELELFGFKGFAIILEGDRTAGEEQLRRVNGSLKLNNPMVLSLDGIDGPGGLALNRRCTLSLIIASSGRVIQSYGYTDTGLHHAEQIRQAFEKAIGDIPSEENDLIELAHTQLPDDPEALRQYAAKKAVENYRLRHQITRNHANSRRYSATRQKMRRSRESPSEETMQAKRRRETETPEPPQNKPAAKSESPQRRGAPPSDSRLNGLLRSFIRKTNTPAQINEYLQQIEERAATSEDLNQQAIAMFQLMLSFPDRYGSDDAKAKAKAFLTTRGAE